MLGMVLGTVCAVGLLAMARRRMRARCGHAGHGRFGRRGWVARSLFERLDTTPGQEKAILSALGELGDNRAALREEMEQTRNDLARAVRGGLIDDATLEESFARHDRLLARLRVSFVEAARKATEALDERQRKILAEFLEKRGWARVWV